MSLFFVVKREEEVNSSPCMVELWILRERNPKEKLFVSLDKINLCPRSRHDLNKVIAEAEDR